jgi:hypothetical protein
LKKTRTILVNYGTIFVANCEPMTIFAPQLGASGQVKTFKGVAKQKKSLLLELFSPNIFSIYKSPYICIRFGR